MYVICKLQPYLFDSSEVVLFIFSLEISTFLCYIDLIALSESQFAPFLYSFPKMNSLGSSSKWPSYDSLPSTPSFLLSESDHTEDEADIFSEGEGDSGISKSFSADEGITLSGSYLGFPDHSDKLYSGSVNDQSGLCAGQTKHPDSAPSPGEATIGSSSATPGDLAFAQKVGKINNFVLVFLSDK